MDRRSTPPGAPAANPRPHRVGGEGAPAAVGDRSRVRRGHRLLGAAPTRVEGLFHRPRTPGSPLPVPTGAGAPTNPRRPAGRADGGSVLAEGGPGLCELLPPVLRAGGVPGSLGPHPAGPRPRRTLRGTTIRESGR